MARPPRIFVAALLVSLLLHLALLGRAGHWWTLPAAEIPFPIEASIIHAPTTPVARPAPTAARPQAAAPAPPVMQPAAPVAFSPAPVAPPASPPEPEPAAAPDPIPAQPAIPEPPAPPPPSPPPTRVVPAPRALPEHLVLRYAVQSGEDGFTLGLASYTWRVRDGRYSLVSVAEASGITALFVSGKIVQTSEGQVTATGLQPEQFWIAKGARRQAPTLFDWGQQRLVLPGGAVALPPLAQDLLSFSFHLAMTVEDDATAWRLPVTNGKRLKDYGFRIVGREHLAVGGDQEETLHVQGNHPEEGSLDVWLAPSRHWLPVRIRTLDQKGKEMVLSLKTMREGTSETAD